ncbi:MAG TPA: DUF5996 family protein, partial [Kofleriaceae bacterium]
EQDPHAKILEFCQSTYEAGANLAGWNRAEFERSETGGGDPDGSAGGAGGSVPRGTERTGSGGPT